MSRFSMEERQSIKDWLEQFGKGNGYPTNAILRFAQSKPNNWLAVQPRDSLVYTDPYDTAEVRAEQLVFGGAKWTQWIAVDARTGEPVVFGHITRR